MRSIDGEAPIPIQKKKVSEEENGEMSYIHCLTVNFQNFQDLKMFKSSRFKDLKCSPENLYNLR